MTDLKTRITRLEKRVAADERAGMTLEELCHFWKETDPEYARHLAEEKGDRFNFLMESVLTSPTPKRVLRMVLAEKRKEASSTADRNERIAPAP